ncbi:hypothetical protein K402DRAFT_464933 [Aulographum hederae CBS 113979]|uniref:EXPERA domain-containing protein n=1 Tax=Aulographum hederae CBS 113979 TaxID=1176131 RepID=A0A6G1GUP4_9PEZI|nr:hypothetical protein K402DRAFT_464933 [Aulographum hederae CBS 113979]
MSLTTTKTPSPRPSQRYQRNALGWWIIYLNLFFVVFYTIILIATFIFAKVHEDEEIRGVYTAGFMFKEWNDGSAEVMMRLWPVLYEGIHLPVYIWMMRTYRLHPVTALVFSIISQCAWVIVALFNTFIGLGAEYKTSPSWDFLSWAAVALPLIIVCVYIALMGCKAHCVRLWRRERKLRGLNAAAASADSYDEGVEIELESQGVKH